MGMSAKQTKGILRLILDALEEVQAEKDPERHTAKLQKVIEHVRDTIED